jgi:dihydrofolate reductase
MYADRRWPATRRHCERCVRVTGADVGRQCIQEGLVDQLLVHLAPVLLGDGVRLFGGSGFERVNLERIGLSV